jgi:hypothetical protein
LLIIGNALTRRCPSGVGRVAAARSIRDADAIYYAIIDNNSWGWKSEGKWQGKYNLQVVVVHQQVQSCALLLVPV